MNVLVTHASKMGGTADLADLLAKDLRDLGLAAEVHPTFLAGDPDDYDVVVVGSALYMNRWRRDARRFVKRYAQHLRRRPVFFFSSGPLDDSAGEHVLPPPKQVRRLMDRAGAVDHAMFGGRLPEDAPGVVAHAMAKEHAGDWRDAAQVDAYAERIASYVRDHAEV
jgi:menaquinone-dependent protoporphyrinogen oxidase